MDSPNSAAESHEAFYRGRLASQHDANGDIAPPWTKYPDYERGTIGWRMGGGEDWLSYWDRFLADLDPAYDVRLAYLKRHPPAPVSWSDHVLRVLRPGDRDPDDADEDADAQLVAQRRGELFGLGLVASDTSYPIWLSQQEGVRWPWVFAETPQTAARYFTRDLWFWSRQVAARRAGVGGSGGADRMGAVRRAARDRHRASC